MMMFSRISRPVLIGTVVALLALVGIAVAVVVIVKGRQSGPVARFKRDII